ncbi:hypothetical protein [Lishizhenia sp.]|uniref:hypothetical protein n=1 Tax=Lishizhenia sp. TaxID=2497594 RepID=UPI00299E67C8|nr:hypothetical protein [Lishizhenia sp.]MDX1446622.1 hypothetical protein [Lishizhenia sp.]
MDCINQKMKTCTSISGGQTSAFLAAKFPSDYNVFSLVRTDDPQCKFPDKKLIQEVEDRIQKPFIGTLEDDKIITTILDLEQFIGRPITWVSGISFDEVINTKGGWLPNKLHRYCTTYLKIEPIFYWWAEFIGEPVEMQIGYRANEQKRAKRMNSKLNDNGLLEYKATFEKNKRGQNKWETVEWQKPVFRLIENGIFKDEIVNYWSDKTVQFAELNNCVGCHHRNPLLLRKMFPLHPNKMAWFKSQEKPNKGTWKTGITYEEIEQYSPQFELDFSEFSDCDSGYCLS